MNEEWKYLLVFIHLVKPKLFPNKRKVESYINDTEELKDVLLSQHSCPLLSPSGEVARFNPFSNPLDHSSSAASCFLPK